MWKRECSSVARQMTVRPRSSPAATPAGKTERPWLNHLLTALSVAALLMLAFGLGRYLGPVFDAGGRAVRGPELAGTATDAGLPAAAGRREVLRPELPADTVVPSGRSPATMPVANLTLDAGGAKPISVPVYDWNDRLGDQLSRRSGSSAVNVFDSLKRHEVRRRQRYVPVRLDDGRHIVVPVEEVDIVPVSATAY